MTGMAFSADQDRDDHSSKAHEDTSGRCAPKTPSDIPDGHASFLANITEPYAYCRLVRDDNGTPCNWVVLDANEPLMDLLDVPDLAGKTFSEGDPRLGESMADALETCARVVTSGRAERVERYLPHLKKWLLMRIMSPAPDRFLTVFEDITELKQIEEALRVTQTTVDWAPDLVQWIDSNGKIVYANEANSRLLGYSREELLGMHIWDLDPDYSPERFYKDWGSVLARGTRLKETTLRGKDGREHPVEVASTNIDIGGERHGVTFIRDIAERKETEEALTRMRFSLDHIGDYLVWLDRTGRIVEVNESTCRALEYTREELLGMTIFDIDPLSNAYGSTREQGLEAYVGAWERYKTLGGGLYPTVHRAKSGRQIPIEANITFESFGGEEYQCSFCRDISERKALEQSLRATQISVDRSPDLIYWTDETGRIVYANEATRRLLGYSAKELESCYLWDFDPDLSPEAYQAAWKEAAEIHEAIYQEAVLVANDESRHAVEITYSLIELQDRRLAVTFARDVTDRKKTEEKLRRSQHALDRIRDYPMWVGPGGAIVEVSESTCRALEYPREELIGMTIFDIDPNVYRDATDESGREISSTWGKYKVGDSVLFETQHRTKSGRLVPVEVGVSFVEFGGVEYQASFCRDISERKRLEESLRATQVSVDRAPDLVYWVDEAGCFAYVNEAACELLGYSNKELESLRLWDIAPDLSPTLFRDSWSEMTVDGEAAYTEATLLSRDGQQHEVEITRTFVELEGRRLAVMFARDVTERKKTEERLRLTRYALDRISDYPIWVAPGGRIAEVSESTCRQLGYTREEILGMTIFDIDPAAPRSEQHIPGQELAKAWEDRREGDSFVFETTHLTKSGVAIPVEVSISFVDFGGVEYQCSFCRDITERRRIQESIRLTHYSVDNASDLIHWLDPTGKVVFANTAACEKNGYSLEEFQKLHIWALDSNVTADDWPGIWERLRGKEPHTIETMGRSRDGTTYPVEVSSQRIEFEGKEYAVSFSRDITERRQAEQTLRESEERYRRLFEVESDAHLLVDDEDYTVLEANKAAVALYGYSRDELLGMSLLDLSNEPEASRSATKHPSLEIPLRWHRKKDGFVFPVEARSHQFEWKGRPVHVIAIRDITERKRTEESLLLIQHAVEQANEMMYWLRPDGSFVFGNKSLCSLLGYTLEELQQLHVWDVVPGGEPEPFSRRWQRIQQMGSLLEEDTLVDRSGRGHAVEISSNIYEHEGKQYGVSFVRDIEERKLAEQSLRDSEERYRQLFELESDALVLASDDSRQILEVNAAAVSLYGYSRAELLSMKDTDLSAGPQNVQATGDPTDGGVPPIYHRKKDGSVFPVEERVGHFEWKGGTVHVAAIRDITQRVRSETELKESRQMLRQVLDTVPLRISWRDRDLRYMGCNIAVALDARLPDTTAIVGLTDYDLPWAALADRSREEDLEVITSGAAKLAYSETVNESPDEMTVIRTSKVPLRDTSDQIIGVLSVHEDITDRVKTLETLRDREDQLRQAQKMEAVGRLAGGIAHDFNNVLTTIIGYSDLLLSAEEYEPESLREDLTEIKTAAERAGNLTRQILAFSRRQALQPQVLSLNTIVSQTERLLTRTLGADIELKTDLSSDLGLVEVDEYQFVQILLNLAVNARDAMPNGGTLAVKTENVDLDEDFCQTYTDCHPGKHILLSVSDTGIGMDADTLAHVFEPFYTTKAPGQGTGLGLSTVYGVVAQSGGTITIQSKPGRGSTFRIYLPRFDHPAMEPEGQTIHTPTADRPTVLVVDDDATFRALTTRILEKRGYRVLPVDDGDRAVELLKNQDTAIHLLLSDVVLPGSLQGGQIGQMAKSLRPGLPVLYMSSYTREAIVQAGRIEGSAPFLEKPFTAESLANLVKELLDSR